MTSQEQGAGTRKGERGRRGEGIVNTASVYLVTSRADRYIRVPVVMFVPTPWYLVSCGLVVVCLEREGKVGSGKIAGVTTDLRGKAGVSSFRAILKLH